MLLDFHGPSPPGSPPSCSGLHRSPASEFPPTLPGSQNHRPPLIDFSLNLVSLLASRGALKFPSSLSPSSLPAAWTTQATDACFWVRTRCWAELRSSSQVGQASDDTQVFTHPQASYCAESRRGRESYQAASLLLAPATQGPDHGRGGGRGGGGGKLRLEAQPHRGIHS